MKDLVVLEGPVVEYVVVVASPVVVVVVVVVVDVAVILHCWFGLGLRHHLPPLLLLDMCLSCEEGDPSSPLPTIHLVGQTVGDTTLCTYI